MSAAPPLSPSAIRAAVLAGGATPRVDWLGGFPAEPVLGEPRIPTSCAERES